MGTFAQTMQMDKRERADFRPLQEKVAFINQFWLDVEHTVFNELPLQFEQTRVYQDGLPICDKEDEIIADIAKLGSPNFKILLRLKEMGATIMGTESASLLIEEYQQAKKIIQISEGDGSQESSTTLEKQEEQEKQSKLLLKRRDNFIAARIDHTLQSGETGILFLGMLHNPVPFLPTDIRVRYPIGKPLKTR